MRMSRPSHSSSCHSTFSLQTSNRFRRESASSGYRPSLQQNTLWKHSGSIMCENALLNSLCSIRALHCCSTLAILQGCWLRLQEPSGFYTFGGFFFTLTASWWLYLSLLWFCASRIVTFFAGRRSNTALPRLGSGVNLMV